MASTYVTRSPLSGVCNSVVYIQSSSSHDNNPTRVTSANCSKANSPTLAECACVNIAPAHCIQLKWAINFRAHLAAVCLVLASNLGPLSLQLAKRKAEKITGKSGGKRGGPCHRLAWCSLLLFYMKQRSGNGS